MQSGGAIYSCIHHTKVVGSNFVAYGTFQLRTSNLHSRFLGIIYSKFEKIRRTWEPCIIEDMAYYSHLTKYTAWHVSWYEKVHHLA